MFISFFYVSCTEDNSVQIIVRQCIRAAKTRSAAHSFAEMWLIPLKIGKIQMRAVAS